jgi:hypothetical protein
MKFGIANDLTQELSIFAQTLPILAQEMAILAQFIQLWRE